MRSSGAVILENMLRKFTWFLFLITFCHFGASAQNRVGNPTPNLPAPDVAYREGTLDSAEMRFAKLRLDSLKILKDSLSTLFIKAADPNRPNRFIDSLINLYKVENFDFAAWARKFPQKNLQFRKGNERTTGQSWIIATILAIILFFALLKNVFAKELTFIFQSFYDNRMLSQISKEDNLFNSWPFLFLYILFGLTFGMFLYLSSSYFSLQYNYQGLEWFLILSAIVICLFTLKILVLRSLGFFFGMQKLVKEYVAVLYLSYFNASFIFLPLIVAYSLTPKRHAEVYGYLAIFAIVLIFIMQLLRAGTNILANAHFSKFYLFIYLCALEICPLLILFKALRF